MKSKRFLAAVMIMILAISSLPYTAAAKSIDEINQEEQAVKEKTSTISTEISSTLDEVNQKYASLEKLKTEISNAETTLSQTEKDIVATQDRIVKRTDSIAERMQGMQIKARQQSTLQVLLDSDSFTDFVSRMYAVSVLQNAQKQKLEALFADRDKLAVMKETVQKTKTELVKKHESLETETNELNARIDGLEQTLSENKELLDKLAADRQNEQNRIQAEKVKKAKEAEAAKARENAEKEAASTVATTESSSSQNSSPDTNPTPGGGQAVAPQPSTPSTGGQATGNGRQVNVQATAYSREEGGYITAVGINLYENPMVIAVDPSVIPLWSIVEVPGYGVAVAGDTGGAIKGNIIDLHMTTIDQCRQWGRRNVTVTIRS